MSAVPLRNNKSAASAVRSVTVLGATGSIGDSTMDLLRASRDRYRVAALTYAVGRAVIRVDHLGMINVLAGREIVREFIQGNCTPANLAAEAARLLDDPAYRTAQVEALAKGVAELGPGGSAKRGAEAILPWLQATN